MPRFYIAHVDGVIYGIGSAPEDAFADAQSMVDDVAGVATQPCTGALYRRVLTLGGAISWGEIDGVACTREAEDRVTAARAQAEQIKAEGTSRSLGPLRLEMEEQAKFANDARSRSTDLHGRIAALRAMLTALEAELPATVRRAEYFEAAARRASDRYQRGLLAVNAADRGADGWKRTKRGTVVKMQPDGKNTIALASAIR